MKRYAWSAMAVLLCLTTGCVERKFIVSTDPPAALVLRNNTVIGPSTADDHFIFYGNYNFSVIKDGYQTLHAQECIAPPWYQIPPLDFLVENLFPFTIVDEHRLNFTLQPLVRQSPQAIADRAVQLQTRAKQIGAPGATPAQAPPPPIVPPGTAPVAPLTGGPAGTVSRPGS
jgi:hypothetical protein